MFLLEQVGGLNEILIHSINGVLLVHSVQLICINVPQCCRRCVDVAATAGLISGLRGSHIQRLKQENMTTRDPLEQRLREFMLVLFFGSAHCCITSPWNNGCTQ